ncbi:MAG: hypothetical protein AB1442_03980 [Nitrospirota bacterium]
MYNQCLHAAFIDTKVVDQEEGKVQRPAAVSASKAVPNTTFDLKFQELCASSE